MTDFDPEGLEFPPQLPCPEGFEQERWDELTNRPWMFVLDENGEAVPERNVLRWGRWMGKHNLERIVARTLVGPYTVSTVFLGIDHGFFGEPRLWETMSFLTEVDNEGFHKSVDDLPFRRWAYREEALRGHEEAVEEVRAVLRRTFEGEWNDDDP